MQFTGGKGITGFVALIVGVCGIGFGSGFLIGREFPAHHFERFGNSSYLLDPSTGKVCDPFKSPQGNVEPAKTGESLDDYLKRASGSDYPPPCGK